MPSKGFFIRWARRLNIDPRARRTTSTAMDTEPPLHPQLPHSLSPNDPHPLRDLGLLDLLEHDPRPTFVLDIEDAKTPSTGIQFIYRNTALTAAKSGALQDAILEKDSTDRIVGENAASPLQFRQWSYRQDFSSCECSPFCGYSWRRCLIARRWIVISGTATESSVHEGSRTDGEFRKNSLASHFVTFDWTDEFPPVKLSAHVVWARSIGWANTPLGPMRGWSPQLRSNASLIMQDPRPAVGFYGPELIMIYNESYIELLGGLHPCMGRSAREVLAPIWDDYFEPIIKRNLAGETVDITHTEIPLSRNGYIEETYFATRFIPIFDSKGATIGHYEPVVEIVSPERSFSSSAWQVSTTPHILLKFCNMVAEKLCSDKLRRFSLWILLTF